MRLKNIWLCYNNNNEALMNSYKLFNGEKGYLSNLGSNWGLQTSQQINSSLLPFHNPVGKLSICGKSRSLI